MGLEMTLRVRSNLRSYAVVHSLLIGSIRPAHPRSSLHARDVRVVVLRLRMAKDKVVMNAKGVEMMSRRRDPRKSSGSWAR
jgi:hypothetical protein